MKKLSLILSVAILAFGMVLTGCPVIEEPTATATPVATAVATATPDPAATATPDPNATATPAPTATPTPTPVALVSISVVPSAQQSMLVGATLDVDVTYNPTDAANTAVTWSSADEAVASVDADGVITAITAGTTYITATSTESASITASLTVVVTDVVVPATSVSISGAATITLDVGASTGLSATKDPVGSTDQIVWDSSDDLIATVSPAGLVTAVAVGTATITATAGSVSDSVDVTVNPILVDGITLDQATATVALVGDTVTLVETVTPSDATDKTVAWSSSDETIATVAAGVVTTLKAGLVTITATTTDGSFVASCDISVAKGSTQGYAADMATSATAFTIAKSTGNDDYSIYFKAPSLGAIAVGDRLVVKYTVAGASGYKQTAAKGAWKNWAWGDSTWSNSGMADPYSYNTTITATHTVAAGELVFCVYIDNAVSGTYPASTSFTLSSMTIENRGPAPSFSGASLNFDSITTGETFGCLGWSAGAGVGTIVNIADITGLPADAGFTKALQCTNTGWNTAIKISNVTIPSSLSSYTTLRVRAYLPRTTIGSASNDGYYYKDLQAFIGTALTGAAQTTTTGYMGKVGTVWDSNDAWKNFDITLDATAKAALASTSGLEIAIGMNCDSTTAFAPYFIDSITLVP